MCGITGVVRVHEESVIRCMTASMAHRGPDDNGIYLDEGISLGMCRLSIIDLSSLVHQPMTEEDESLWIVYNGETYNFLDLNHQLIKQGHRIKNRSDTETILHLYE